MDDDAECPFCHMHNVNDDWVFVCQTCGAESCPDCAGRCGCPQDSVDETFFKSFEKAKPLGEPNSTAIDICLDDPGTFFEKLRSTFPGKHVFEQVTNKEIWGTEDCECHYCIKTKNLRSDGEHGWSWPLSAVKMILCPDCGNKRCPKASNHELRCTGSNEPGQAGSVYQ